MKECAERVAWAAKMHVGMVRRGWPRPRTPFAWLRLLWQDFVVHGLFGPGGEVCQDCGRGYPLWHAEKDLWSRIVGGSGGMLCPSCFDRRARRLGLDIEFRAMPFERPSPEPFQ